MNINKNAIIVAMLEAQVMGLEAKVEAFHDRIVSRKAEGRGFQASEWAIEVAERQIANLRRKIEALDQATKAEEYSGPTIEMSVFDVNPTLLTPDQIREALGLKAPYVPYEEGFCAFKNSKPRSANPHKAGLGYVNPPSAIEWYRGWDDAAEKQAIHPEELHKRRMRAAFDIGRASFADGKPIDDNPQTVEEYRVEQDRGWLCAKADKIEAEQKGAKPNATFSELRMIDLGLEELEAFRGNARVDGAIAAMEGRSSSENPFNVSDDRYPHWCKGYRSMVGAGPKSAAYVEGYKAYEPGKVVLCPYKEKSSKHNNWSFGYLDACHNYCDKEL